MIRIISTKPNADTQLENDMLGQDGKLTFRKDEEACYCVLHFEGTHLERLHGKMLLVVPDLHNELAIDGHGENALPQEACSNAWTCQ